MRNLEFKAALSDEKEAIRRARSLGAEIWGDLRQTDTYFTVPNGRLKLRETAGFDAELISYDRDETVETRLSDFTRGAVRQPEGVREALARALGVVAVVHKRRTLLLVDTIRIHLDNVEGLGRFLEIEVPVDPAPAFRRGHAAPDDRSGETDALARLAGLIGGLGYTLADGIRQSYLEMVLAAMEKPA